MPEFRFTLWALGPSFHCYDNKWIYTFSKPCRNRSIESAGDQKYGYCFCNLLASRIFRATNLYTKRKPWNRAEWVPSLRKRNDAGRGENGPFVGVCHLCEFPCKISTLAVSGVVPDSHRSVVEVVKIGKKHIVFWSQSSPRQCCFKLCTPEPLILSILSQLRSFFFICSGSVVCFSGLLLRFSCAFLYVCN